MFRAALAQLVEHIIRNDGVACSSHASGTSKTKHLAPKIHTVAISKSCSGNE